MKRLLGFMLSLVMPLMVWSQNITFADANVKAICVQNWDTNGDGELSEAEAAAVTDLESVFNGNTEITSFNELQYFTGLSFYDEWGTQETVSGITRFAFQGCSNLEQVTLPALEAIGDGAFMNSGLTAITIPNTVRIIRDGAFDGTNISEFVLPASVTDITYGIVGGDNLKSIIVESGNPVYDSRDNCNAIIKTSDNQLLIGCAKSTIPASVTSIRETAFQRCKGLQDVVIPDNVTSIGRDAFAYSGMTSLSIGKGLSSIGENAFTGLDNLTTITVNGENATFDSRYNCNAIVKKANNTLIFGCGGSTIPAGVTAIGDNAFWECGNLAAITIPATVTTIGNSAFWRCKNLMTVTVEWTEPITITSSGVFSTDLTGKNKATLYVPAGSKAAYETATGWKDFKEIVEGSPANNYKNLITNSDMEGTDVSCFFSKEVGKVVDPVPHSTIVDGAGKGDSRGIVVNSSDDPEYSWDNQFFVRLPKPLPSGTKYRVRFDYKASRNAEVSTQMHTEPGGYIHGDGIGSPNFTTEWQTYEHESVISVEQSPEDNMQTIAFNLSESSAATTYYFDNFVFEIDENHIMQVSAVKTHPVAKILSYTGEPQELITAGAAEKGKMLYRVNWGGFSEAIPTATEVGSYTIDYKASGGEGYIDSKTYTITAGILPAEMTDLVVNGDMEGDDVSCFYKLENLAVEDIVVSANISEGVGKDGSRGIVVNSVDNPAEDWNTEFYVRLPKPLPAGIIYHVKFDYKASQEAEVGTVIESEPCKYIHWEGIGSLNFTTEWQTYEHIGTISADQSPEYNMQTIAFQLAKLKSAASYYFDNIVFEIDANQPISFADANVKALCVANWDTNGDGELSEDEAAAVTDLGNVFNGNKEITSFNELQYFTGLLCNDEDLSGNTYSGIPYFAFMGCTNLKQVTLPNVEAIGHAAFSGSGLTAITIPSTVRMIGDEAFYNTNISDFVLPASVTDLCDGYAVAGIISSPNLKSIVVESGNSVYDSRNNCNAIVRTASNELVNGCSTTTIPGTVTSIRQYAFMGCQGLTAITIPISVTSIGGYAFEGCNTLTSVTVENPMPFTIGNGAFSNCANATLHVPAGSKAAYKDADGWKDFKEIVEPVVPGSAEDPFTCAEAIALVSGLTADTPTETEYYVKGKVCKMQYNYSYQYGTASFWISEDGTDNGSFYVYRTLYFDKESYNGGRVPNIGDEVVLCGQMVNYKGTTPETYSRQCRLVSLNNKTVGTGLEVGDLFVAKTLEDVELFFVVDDTGKSLGKSTVTGCSVGYAVGNRPETYTNAPACIDSNYEGTITIPEIVEGLPVQAVAPSAFAGAKLTAVTMPATIWDIETNAFSGCTQLASVNLPQDVILNNGTFMNCTSLTSVELPKGVQLWAMDVIFKDCSNLTSITVNDETPYELQGSYLVDDPSKVTLYVPVGSKAAYEAADYWKEFGEIIEKEPEVPVNEIWSGSQVIKEWSNLTLGKEYMESLNIGDVLHVTVTDVAESEANVALLDGSWTGIAPWYGLSPEMTEAVFTLTGDMVRELKRYGMVLSCHGYTIKRIYTTPAYTGSENSIWLGNQTNGDISVGFDHFHIANRKTGIKAGDVIRLSYTGNGTPNVWYIGDDWTWKEFTDATLSTTETGAEVTVTGAMATLLNNDKDLIVQLGDAGLTLTQVELISGAHTVVYQVGEGETFASGTQKELENITLTYGETGGVDFQTATAWTCEAEGLEFPYYSPGNGINGNKDGGTFYVFKPKKNGLLTVVVNQNAIKPFYVEENGSVMDQFNGITKGEDGTYQGTYKIEVKANRTYKVYCSGSKLGFYGFIYDWRDNANLINIEFASEYTKQMCVSAFDTNGDGELSEAEAAAVTDLGDVFKENTEITLFDEFRYFSGVTELPGWMAFEGCTKLKSIIIPVGVTSINGSAFANCAALEKISVDAMNSIYESPAGCNAVIEKASNKLVVGCDNTVIPNTVTTIGDASFWGRWSMTKMDIPESVKTIESCAFAFSNMSEFTMPSKVESIWPEAFAYTGMGSVTLPVTLTVIGDGAFKGCDDLVEVTVENPTPVAITEEVFSNRANATLYVPEGCVAAYRAADYWKEFGTIMSYGGSSLYADDLQTLPGTTAVLAVNLDNVDKAIACKFDLRLPTGVTVVTKSNGKLDATLTERAKNHSISSSHLDNGDYSFVITSLDNDLFTGNSGALVEIKLDIPSTMECGDYTVQVFNTDLTAFRDNTSTNVKLDDMDSKLSVTYTPGDVNCDGSVSVTDVGCTINYILKKVPEVFVKDAADMDGDNEITVTDVTRIIAFILDDDASMAPRRSGYDPVIPHLSLQQTADGYALTMDEKDAFVGFQFDVELAAGATVNSMQLNSNSDHLLTYRRLDNGMYRVVCYSLSNSTFADDEAPLLNMSVTGDVSVSSVLLTTAGLTGLRATVSDDQSTGVASMNQGLQMSVQGRTLQIVADRDVTLRLYTTGGSVYRVLNVHSGVNTFEGLKAGVYMIENRKMIIR